MASVANRTFGVDPAGKGHCLASELVELVRRKRERLVLASGLRPQCVMSENSVLSLRYWAASGIESIDVYLYVFGIETRLQSRIANTEA